VASKMVSKLNFLQRKKRETNETKKEKNKGGFFFQV